MNYGKTSGNPAIRSDVIITNKLKHGLELLHAWIDSANKAAGVVFSLTALEKIMKI
jgi:hypothetical protein